MWVTVGYFDVVAETPSPIPNAPHVTLGNEYFREVPGDTRHKFFAVVDRTKVGLDPLSYQNFQSIPASPPPVHANPAATNPNGRPFFTTVEANVNAGPFPPGPASIVIAAPNGQVYSDGVPVTITPGATLVIGVGANQEIVTVAGVVPDTNPTGLSTVTLTGPLVKNHQACECVSNIVPGNPGPQPNFDVNNPMYQPVVPYWSRVP